MMLAAPGLAGAIGNDSVELFVVRELTNDDNVFRLADDVNSETAIGSADRGDTLHTTSVGLQFELPVSRQTFRGEIAMERVRFERFTSLDLDGHRGSLQWDWQFGERWSGRLGGSETETLASLANVVGGVQTNSPNFLTISTVAGNTEYKLTERWRLSAGLHRAEHDNSSEESRISDATMDGTELGVRYLTPGRSEFGVRHETVDALLPVQQLVNGAPVDNSYRQQQVSVFARWPVTAEVLLRASLGEVSRDHEQLPERDYSDSIHSFGADWQAADSLRFGITRARGISQYEQVNVGLVVLESLDVRASWEITEKLAVTISQLNGDRRYLADPALALSPSEPRTEDVNMTQLELSYLAADFLTLGIDWRSDSRRSPVQFGDYDANVVTLRVRGQF
jgi:hypothetical protein